MLQTKKQKGNKLQPTPSSADEFLAAGVEYEEAGEKWRAGDAAKSTRFFERAIQVYDTGLREFAQSFELAYNKARIQYEIAQQPRLLHHLSVSQVDLLQAALVSHRQALDLNPENADILFNTAQVLTSLAEDQSEGPASTSDIKAQALSLLREALELFQKCLEVQQYRYTQAHADEDSFAESADPSDHAMADSDSRSSSVEDERWASIVEPVTESTLLDTVVAQLDTLTAICNLMISLADTRLSWIEDFYNVMVEPIITTYSDNKNRPLDVSLAGANFTCAYADLTFRTGLIDAVTYEREIAKAFGDSFEISSSARALCDRADAFFALCVSFDFILDQTFCNYQERANYKETRWKYLTDALEDLKSAAKLSDAENLPKIHLRRGDCELMRFSMGEAPIAFERARNNSATLLQNAETYYRGGSRIAKAQGAVDEEQESTVKEAVVARLQGDEKILQNLASIDSRKVAQVLEEMKEEGLIIESLWKRLASELKGAE